jgi:hypothetical protein
VSNARKLNLSKAILISTPPNNYTLPIAHLVFVHLAPNFQTSIDGIRWGQARYRYQIPSWTVEAASDPECVDAGAPPLCLAPHTPRLDMTLFYIASGIAMPSA